MKSLNERINKQTKYIQELFVENIQNVNPGSSPLGFDISPCVSGVDGPTAQFRHWLVVNMPGWNLDSADTVTEYVGVRPPKGKGLQRLDAKGQERETGHGAETS